MNKIKFYPAPHTEVILHVSDQMEKDMKECYDKALGKGSDCDKCSWNDVKPFSLSMCEIEAVVNKIVSK